MSVGIVGNSGMDIGGAAQIKTEQARARATEQRPASTTTAPVKLALRPAGNAPAAVSAQPPAGTDPQLWSVLTSEERAFFSKAATSGPLTYGRIMSRNASGIAAGPSVRGARIDVRA